MSVSWRSIRRSTSSSLTINYVCSVHGTLGLTNFINIFGVEDWYRGTDIEKQRYRET